MGRTRTWVVLLTAWLITGCAALPPSAIITKEHVEVAFAQEGRIAPHAAAPPPSGKPWFEIRPGKSPILLVAGHATNPRREGKVRFADSGTGGFALALAALTDSTLIYTTYASPSDPNFYDDNEFKRALKKLVETEHPRLVLDIHGSHWYRPYDVDFGTMDLKSLCGRKHYLHDLIAAFRAEGIDNLSVDYFSAATNQTVTKFVSRLGVPCVQLEMNSNVMPVPGDTQSERPQRVAQTLQALTRFIRAHGSD